MTCSTTGTPTRSRMVARDHCLSLVRAVVTAFPAGRRHGSVGRLVLASAAALYDIGRWGRVRRAKGCVVKVVVIGGTGLIGSKLVAKLGAHGHEAVPAAPNTGVNSLTGEGLAGVLDGAAVVVDVSDSPSFAEDAVMEFFRTATSNLLKYSARAGVGHYVALSVVGTDRLSESGYFRAKIVQEQLIRESGRPYSIVHATQFFEFVTGIADLSMVDGEVRLPPVLIQPMAADDVAAGVGRVAVGEPLNGICEIGGPEQFRLDGLVRKGLEAKGDPRVVVADELARYSGARVGELTLVPGPDAQLGEVTFDKWLAQQ